MPFLNFGTITAFLAWFGGSGYLLTRYSSFVVAGVLMLAVVTGLAGASIVFWFVAKLLLKHDRELDPADYDRVGVLARISSPVREGGTGEIIFSQEGTRNTCGARSEGDEALARGTEVIVTRYEHGIAYVRRWEELAEKDAASKLSFQGGSMGFHIPTEVLIVVWTAVAADVMIVAVFARLYRKAGPNEVLVVYGFRGTRVVKGHGTVIFPMVETYRELSLELMSFDVAPQQDLYTKQGVAEKRAPVTYCFCRSNRRLIVAVAGILRALHIGLSLISTLIGLIKLRLSPIRLRSPFRHGLTSRRRAGGHTLLALVVGQRLQPRIHLLAEVVVHVLQILHSDG